MHPLARLARDTIDMYVREGRTPDERPALPPELPSRAGAFVSLHIGGDLRGCIGTIEPSQASLASEVIRNAVSAATRDPRFPAVTPAELDRLDIKVDVLSEPEPVVGPEELDPKRYGVIVESRHHSWKRGLLLPDLEGVRSVAQQLEIARRKAGLSRNEPIRLLRFTVQRYS
jgi:AmmeMemoRadiSam system protein A